jgi:hypothetical protein
MPAARLKSGLGVQASRFAVFKKGRRGKRMESKKGPVLDLKRPFLSV